MARITSTFNIKSITSSFVYNYQSIEKLSI